MKWILWVVFGLGVYIVFVLVTCRVLAMNTQLDEIIARHTGYNRRRRGFDRRMLKMPVAVERRVRERRVWSFFGENGAVAVFITIILALVIMPLMGLALGIGNMHAMKTQSQAVADAVALGASNALYNDEPRPEFSEPGPANTAGNALITANGYNLGNGNGSCSFVLGHWNLTTRVFTPGALGNMPEWETATLEGVYADTFYTNAARATCDVQGELFFAGMLFDGVATATAMKRIVASEGGGVEHARGSGLVQ